LYRFTSDAGIGVALRVDVVDGDIMFDDTDMPELEGLALLLGAVHAPLVVATGVALAEGTGDEGGKFCGIGEAPGLLTVI
jgi:hypothetical protein